MNSRPGPPVLRAEDLTPDFITGLLSQAGILNETKVTSLSLESIGEGHGFVGRSIRCLLSYDHSREPAPASLVIKTATEDLRMRSGFHDFGLYEREVRFYKELRDEVGVPAPHCYLADIDSETGEFILILEDLAPATPGNPLTGCTVEQAREALDLIASMHHRWWNSRGLERMSWLPVANAQRIIHGVDTMFDEAWASFTARVSANFPKSILKVGDSLGRYLPEVLSRLSSPPYTLVHGDYQMGNIFYSGDGRIAALADWQVIIKARGAMDVAHFVARSLQPGDRKSAERDLVRHYHTNLLDRGVEDYDFSECWNDYRLAVLSQFGLGVLLSHGLAVNSAQQTPDGARDALAAVVGGRLIAALDDLRPEEILESRPLWRRLPLVFRR